MCILVSKEYIVILSGHGKNEIIHFYDVLLIWIKNINAYLNLHGETKGYTTVLEAESEYDIFHPNCIHTLRITDGVLQQYEYLGVDVPTEKYVETFTTFKNQAEKVADDIKSAVFQKGMKPGTYQKATLDYLREKIPEETKKETFRIGTIPQEIKAALGAKMMIC